MLRTEPCSLQSMHKEKLSQTLPMQGSADSHPSQKCYRKGKSRELPGQVLRQIGSLDRMRRQSIKTGDGLAVRSENEDSGKFAFQVLAGLSVDIIVEGCYTARKGRSVMERPKRLNLIFDVRVPAGH